MLLQICFKICWMALSKILNKNLRLNGLRWMLADMLKACNSNDGACNAIVVYNSSAPRYIFPPDCLNNTFKNRFKRGLICFTCVYTINAHVYVRMYIPFILP
jgi:hypothetical protein